MSIFSLNIAVHIFMISNMPNEWLSLPLRRFWGITFRSFEILNFINDFHMINY